MSLGSFSRRSFLQTVAAGSVAGVKRFDCIEAMKALGEENRLRIVRLLLGGERGVNEIAEVLGISQYNVSKHLRVLRAAGLVECEKQGRLRLHALALEIKSRLSGGDMVLDLGCCQFDFTKLPK